MKYSTINYLGTKDRYKTFKCHLGLETISIPIKVFDTTIGFIVMSRFFTKEPNIKYFERIEPLVLELTVSNFQICMKKIKLIL